MAPEEIDMLIAYLLQDNESYELSDSEVQIIVAALEEYKLD